MPLALVIQPADDAPGIVLDPEFTADAEPLVPVQEFALFGDSDRNLDIPCGDVTLEGLELFWGQVGKDLVGLGLVAVEPVHG
jgi:hypothetical protein